jgi:hypothetical protein
MTTFDKSQLDGQPFCWLPHEPKAVSPTAPSRLAGSEAVPPAASESFSSHAALLPSPRVSSAAGDDANRTTGGVIGGSFHSGDA